MDRRKAIIASTATILVVGAIWGSYVLWKRFRIAVPPVQLAEISDLAIVKEWRIGDKLFATTDSVSGRFRVGETLPAVVRIETNDENWSNYFLRGDLRKIDASKIRIPPRLNLWMRMRQKHAGEWGEQLKSTRVLNGGPAAPRELSMKGKFVAPLRRGVYELQLVVHPMQMGTGVPNHLTDGKVLARTLIEVTPAE